MSMLAAKEHGNGADEGCRSIPSNLSQPVLRRIRDEMPAGGVCEGQAEQGSYNDLRAVQAVVASDSGDQSSLSTDCDVTEETQIAAQSHQLPADAGARRGSEEGYTDDLEELSTVDYAEKPCDTQDQTQDGLVWARPQKANQREVAHGRYLNFGTASLSFLGC